MHEANSRVWVARRTIVVDVTCLYAWRGLFTLGAIVGLLLGGMSPGRSDENRWGNRYDILVGQQGVSVTVERDDEGVERRIFRLPGDVTIQQGRTNGRLSTISQDQSGLGAVGCSLMITVSMRQGLLHCKGLQSWAHEAELMRAIERMKKFAAENSYGVLSVDYVDAWVRFMEDGDQQQIGANDGESVDCRDTDLHKIVEHMLGRPAEGIRKATDKLLSVQRFPAMGPCM